MKTFLLRGGTEPASAVVLGGFRPLHLSRWQICELLCLSVLVCRIGVINSLQRDFVKIK